MRFHITFMPTLGTLSQENTGLSAPPIRTSCSGPDLWVGWKLLQVSIHECSLFLRPLAQREILVAPASNAPLHGHDICVAHILR